MEITLQYIAMSVKSILLQCKVYVVVSPVSKMATVYIAIANVNAKW